MTDLRYLLAIYVHAHQTGNSVPPHIDAEARAALADGPAVPQPQPPAEGEVEELVQHLHHAAEVDGWDGASPEWCQSMLRAAELLQRLSPPQPVPVSERLPGPEDCAPWPGEPNAGHWCWMASCVDNGWAWEQRTLGFLASFPQDFTHWLSAHALPIPHQQENAND